MIVGATIQFASVMGFTCQLLLLILSAVGVLKCNNNWILFSPSIIAAVIIVVTLIATVYIVEISHDVVKMMKEKGEI